MPRLLMVFLCLSLVFTCARAGDVTVRWQPPTANTDGSMPPDLGGYVVSCSTDPAIPAGNLKTVTLTDPALTSYVVTDLTPGTWYFTLRSVALTDPKVLSQRTNITSSVVAAEPPPCGPAPASESRPQTCPAPTIGNWTQTHGWTAAPAPTCWTPDAWLPTNAPAGICATPSLTTASTKAYEQVSATLPLALRGLTLTGLPCGPETLVRNGVRYCVVSRSAVDLVVWPSDLALTKLWVPTQ